MENKDQVLTDLSADDLDLQTTLISADPLVFGLPSCVDPYLRLYGVDHIDRASFADSVLTRALREPQPHEGIVRHNLKVVLDKTRQHHWSVSGEYSIHR